MDERFSFVHAADLHLDSSLIRSLAGLTGHAIAGRYIEPPGEEEWERLLNQAEDLALDLLEDGGRS